MTVLQSIKKKIWPVKPQETKKILQICAFKGLVSSVFCILSNVKDAIIIGGPHSSAEIIPVIKGFLVLPVSLFFVVIYASMRNKYSGAAVFYVIMTFFLISFSIFSFVLLPLEDHLVPYELSAFLQKHISPQNHHWIAVLLQWPRTIFFILCELWSQASIFILFWEFVNRICSISEAKRSYNLFITAGSLFNVVTSSFLIYMLKDKTINFIQSFQHLSIILIALILLNMLLYRNITKDLPDKKLKTKTKLPLFQSLKYILKSKYLLHIAVTVVSVGLTINLIEITWKANLKILFPNENDIMRFMTKVNFMLHLGSILVAFLISGNLIRKMSWRFNANIAPIMIMITGTLFFLSSKFRNSLEPISNLLDISPLKIVVYLGAFQVIVSKLSKYAFYDLTKEISYIPLDEESRVKGKAAIDSVGSRFGKSGSSYIHLFVLWLYGTGSVLSVTSILIPILITISFCWLRSNYYISTKIDEAKSE